MGAVTAPAALRALDLFADCDDDELVAIAPLLRPRQADAGDTLMGEGTPGGDFIIITEGEAAISLDEAGGRREVSIVGSGSFVGEISLLRDVLHSATVRAVRPVSAYVCERGDFPALMAVPGVAERAAATRVIANRWARLPAFEIGLRDGTRLGLRPIAPTDKERLVDAMARMSIESRRRRFFGAKHSLSTASLAYLTEVDLVDHFAWIATALDEPGEPTVGVARYVRTADDPEAAELALTVVDDFQGKGLGSLLYDALGLAARANGIRRFVLHVLYENGPMRGLVRKEGGTFAFDEPGVLVAVVDIAEGTPAAALAAVRDALRVGPLSGAEAI